MNNAETKLTMEEVSAEFQCPYKAGTALKKLFNEWKCRIKEVKKMTKEEFIIYLRQTIHIVKRNCEVLKILYKYSDINDYPNSDAVDLLIKVLATQSILNYDEMVEYIYDRVTWSILPRDEELGDLYNG